MGTKLSPDSPVVVTQDEIQLLRMDMIWEAKMVSIVTSDPLNGRLEHRFEGNEARTMMRVLNKRDFSGTNKRMRQQVLEYLIAQGRLPTGTVTEDESDLDNVEEE